MIRRAGSQWALTAFLLIAATSVTEAETLTLQWDAASDSVTTGYIVWYGTATGVYTKSIDVGFVTSYSLATLSPETTYYFVVQAYDAGGGTSPQSLEVSGTTSGDGGGGGGGDDDGGGELTPPSALTAAVRDERFIDLRWQNGSSATTGVRVEIGTASGLTDAGTLTTGVTTSFTVGDLPAKTYFIRLRAINGSIVSAPSNEVAVTVGAGPDAPLALTASIVGNIVSLDWAPPTAAATVIGYQIEAGTAPGRSDLAQLRVADTTFTTYTVPTGDYFVRVRSITSAGVGSASNEVVLAVGTGNVCATAPGTPSLSTSISGSSVSMRWSPGTGDGPTAYVLDLLAPSTRAVIATAQFGLDRRFFSATVAQGTYVLRLTAVNACGATQWPAESTLLVGTAAPTLPGLPGQPAAVVAAHAVTLNWTAPAAGPAPSHYVIEAVDGSDNVLLTVNTGNASTTFSHSSVPAGEYRVRVRAANGAGLGLPSTAVHITVAP